MVLHGWRKFPEILKACSNPDHRFERWIIRQAGCSIVISLYKRQEEISAISVNRGPNEKRRAASAFHGGRCDTVSALSKFTEHRDPSS